MFIFVSKCSSIAFCEWCTHCFVVSWRLKSPTTQSFVQQLVSANIKGNIKAPLYWPFVSVIHHRSPVVPPLVTGGGFHSQRVSNVNSVSKPWGLICMTYICNVDLSSSLQLASLICDFEVIHNQNERFLNNFSPYHIRHRMDESLHKHKTAFVTSLQRRFIQTADKAYVWKSNHSTQKLWDLITYPRRYGTNRGHIKHMFMHREADCTVT